MSDTSFVFFWTPKYSVSTENYSLAV